MNKLRDRVEKFNGLSVGLDLHKKFIQVSALAPEGNEIRQQRIPAEAQALTACLDELAALPQAKAGLAVALEASGCFFWVYDLLKPRLGDAAVRVAAPSKVKVIAQAGEKTDASDAWWLAYLLQEGRLPEAFVAEGDLRELRIACRELRSVVDERSDLKRRLRSHLSQLGVEFAKSAWASGTGRQRITALVEQAQREHGQRGQAIARLWRRIQQMDEEVDYWHEQIAQLAGKFDQVKLLDDELPGVGPVIASAIWSELGEPSRYRSAKAYAKATGLTPGYRESGGYRRKGKMTREGSAHARWALTRAVMSCTRCTKGPGLAVKRWLQRQYRRKPKKAAIVAAARKLAEGIWRLLKLGEAFDLRRAFP